MAFTQLRELIQLAETKGTSIGQVMLEVEREQSGRSEEEIMELMARQFAVMEEAARKGVEEPIHSRTGLTGGDAFRVNEYLAKGKTFLDPHTLRAMSYALSVNEVNAGMGRIVATPTAGSAGILPGVLVSILDRGGSTRESIIFSLLTAAALGLVIANSASISGAAGGCQAEIGSATAMAAGAVVEIGGGTPEQVGHAVGLALKNSLGLVCDPVGGLVEIPCIIRNGLHAVTALAAADMALAGVKSMIPPDEVIQAMYEIGNELPESLRETGLGGLAATPTGQALREQVFGKPCETR
ncbi:L-serine ammonia-lyase, iron-sulfur-dependent, subunit alpha [Alicyclobacillus dauci]|uniref:L-serine dehydratase n=1 Tax=Alicyclobacillus dauci TaxID=1475485 RepID=A0ABY6Z2T8_9BACL|nr:L-serine ammonia-lyase, iron-sulfur-dependent, subunit alpha [Alicyclobacillus dauci]WAH36305.1 L-serine ammonia-lyase, iron-sulfur-dependent, subunit alpha [Alicyclobacillus dauci]